MRKVDAASSRRRFYFRIPVRCRRKFRSRNWRKIKHNTLTFQKRILESCLTFDFLPIHLSDAISFIFGTRCWKTLRTSGNIALEIGSYYIYLGRSCSYDICVDFTSFGECTYSLRNSIRVPTWGLQLHPLWWDHPSMKRRWLLFERSWNRRHSRIRHRPWRWMLSPPHSWNGIRKQCPM